MSRQLFFWVVGAHVCVNSMSPGFLEPTTPRVYKTRQIQEIEQVGRGGMVGQVGVLQLQGNQCCFPPIYTTTFWAEW